ncbi:PTS system protein [Klebsiella variicola]|nr:PTS system protein [Klebsiella variicola]
MEITLLQIVLVFIVACIAGMESVLDEFQFHRPLGRLYADRLPFSAI